MPQPGLKGILSPQMKAAIRKNLRHRVTIVRAGKPDRHGELTEGEDNEWPCRISGTTRRVLNQDGVLVQATHDVEFGPDADVKVNDELKNGTARDGELLLEAGRIVLVDDQNHDVMGRVGQVASVQVR